MGWKELFRNGTSKVTDYFKQVLHSLKSENEKPFFSSKSRKILLRIAFAFLFILLNLAILFFIIPSAQQLILSSLGENSNELSEQEVSMVEKKVKVLSKSVIQLEKKLIDQIPNTTYMIVNISDNKFYVYRKEELLKQGKCSTGSYILLKKGDTEQWIFKTPRGEYRIQGKTERPVWKKPDWAFVEEGLPIPTANHSSRFEYGVLGDYALSLGSGYLIHGTLYKRLLGMPVTHGCVRLNDEDLEYVFNTLSVGSRVIMY